MTDVPRATRDELFEKMGEYAAKTEAERAQIRTFAALLRAGATLFGMPAEIHFPEGQPYGMSNAELADMIDPLVSKQWLSLNTAATTRG